jgi:hypothetical protein
MTPERIEEIRLQAARYHVEHRDKRIEVMRQYHLDNKESEKIWRDQYYVDNRTKLLVGQKEYASKNKEKIQTSRKQHYMENIEKNREYAKEYYYRNRDKMLKLNIDYQFKKRYGISLVDYNEMVEHQEGKCLICGTHKSSLDRSLTVDHDHATGKVRGLLCYNCNLVLGNAKDNVNTLQKAIEYLNKTV